jgi:hypothetical protein
MNQLSEISLGSEHDSVVMTAYLKDIYSTACTSPSPERSPMFFAELHLLAKRDGRHDSAHTYEAYCHDALHRIMFTDEYFSFILGSVWPRLIQVCQHIASRHGPKGDTLPHRVYGRKVQDVQEEI